jgi:PAP2 superfamily
MVRRIHPQTASPWPWQYFDPAWVYSGETAPLLAQALNKVRSRIVRPSDPRQALAPANGAPPLSTPELADKLWRWEPSFRAKAVVAELLTQVSAVDHSVWCRQRSVVAGKPGYLEGEFFKFTPPGPDFNHDIQIDKTVRAAVEREDRLPEILSQSQDLRPFFNAITGLDRMQVPRVGELFDVAWEWATFVVMTLKHNVAALRPIQRSALVIPVIATPGHGSLPSGHATIAALTSELLGQLLEPNAQSAKRRQMLDRLARRIAYNRVVAGVHFQIDSVVGYALGRHLAWALMALAQGGPLPQLQSPELAENSTLDENAPYEAVPLSNAYVQPAPLLALMWAAAQRELDSHWFK